VDEVMEKDWDDVVAVNLKGSFFCTKALLPIMKERNRGRIINIGSRASLGKYARTVYSATKAGLIGMTRTWALELAPFNITVNYIGPGLIATDLFRQVNPSDSERTQRLVKSIPLNRLGTPEDLANTISFLASDEAAYITGQTLFVCGGLSVQSVQW
jgi:3-oxoacyl-[acyl-carrier protein] reductase